MTDIKLLQKKVIEFRDKRNWKQFHSVKDLLLGMDIECAELMEKFLWKSEDEITAILRDKTLKKEIEDEMGDIFIFMLYLSEAFDIDLTDCADRKLKKNAGKYPVRKSFNSNLKYNKF